MHVFDWKKTEFYFFHFPIFGHCRPNTSLGIQSHFLHSSHFWLSSLSELERVTWWAYFKCVHARITKTPFCGSRFTLLSLRKHALWGVRIENDNLDIGSSQLCSLSNARKGGKGGCALRCHLPLCVCVCVCVCTCLTGESWSTVHGRFVQAEKIFLAEHSIPWNVKTARGISTSAELNCSSGRCSQPRVAAHTGTTGRHVTSSRLSVSVLRWHLFPFLLPLV